MKNRILIALFSIAMLYSLAIPMHAQNRRNQSSQETRHSKKTRKVVITTRPGRIQRARVVYRRPTTRVVAVRRLPKNTVVIPYNGLRYHYANGHYYRYYGGSYIVVAPHIGLRVRALPIGFMTIYLGPTRYFYFDGIYYSPADNQYRVVEPEIGMIVSVLPVDYEKVAIDGQTYYEYNNVLYKKVNTDNGKAYEVVGIID